jgi:hypothetical protein
MHQRVTANQCWPSIFCIVRRNGVAAADLIYPSLMNASAPQWFWITWGVDNLVTLGRGRTVGSDHLLVHNESSPIQVNYMAVGSIQMGNSATWIVPAAFYSNSLCC